MEIDSFDSKEEKWFSYYLSELKAHGLISDWEYQPETYVLCDEATKHVFIKKRKHNEPTTIKLLNGAEYTPDFKVTWNKKAEGICYWLSGGVYDKGVFPYSKTRRDNFVPFVAYMSGSGEITSIIDTKGTFGASDRAFSLTQKWMMSKGLFVQKVVVSLCDKGVFHRSFFPRVVVAEEVYKRDGKRGDKSWKAGDSKIKVEIRLIEKWLKMKGYGTER